MAKLDLAGLRRSAQDACDTLARATAYKRSLVDGLHRLIFECSPNGVITLTTMAHMSLIAEGLPTDIVIGANAAFKGEDVTCHKEVDGTWTARVSHPIPREGLRPLGLTGAIASAAGIPHSKEALASIRAVINPLHERDFDHFARVLDLIPLHSLSAMMAYGPLLARSLDLSQPAVDDTRLGAGKAELRLPISHDQYHEDIAKFARCVSEAVQRRGASVAGLDVDLRSAVDEFRMKFGEEHSDEAELAFRGLPTCVQMFDPHVPTKAIEAFLREAVRAGFDINAVSPAPSSYPRSAADCAVNLLDVKALIRLEKLGLDLGRANEANSLTSVALSRVRRTGDRKVAFAVLKHLVVARGLPITAESHRNLAESLNFCRCHLHSGYADTRLLSAKYEVLTNVMEFVEKMFPNLRKPPKSHRRAA
ncbi:hypothetical protein G6L37_00410 [Agrobacterium rubi]|nr:hypothetical protein [Agrobacterium rubi]NTF23851.1 hypothetical protein [Agrobacterium rubi]